MSVYFSSGMSTLPLLSCLPCLRVFHESVTLPIPHTCSILSTGTSQQPGGCLCSCPIPHVHLPVHYVHKWSTVFYNPVSYFGCLINRGSVCVSAPCFICEKSSWWSARDNGWLDWRTYHFGSHVWKNAGTWPSQNQCGLALVDCELVTGLDVTPTRYWDQRFIKVCHETFVGHSRQKDWMCELLSAVHEASETKSHSPAFLVPLLLTRW